MKVADLPGPAAARRGRRSLESRLSRIVLSVVVATLVLAVGGFGLLVVSDGPVGLGLGLAFLLLLSAAFWLIPVLVAGVIVWAIDPPAMSADTSKVQFEALAADVAAVFRLVEAFASLEPRPAS